MFVGGISSRNNRLTTPTGSHRINPGGIASPGSLPYDLRSVGRK